jgi:hypothetical protein
MSSAIEHDEKSMVKDSLALTNLNDTIPEPERKILRQHAELKAIFLCLRP